MLNCQKLKKEDSLIISATIKKIKTILSTKKNNGLQKNATVKKIKTILNIKKENVTASKKADTN